MYDVSTSQSGEHFIAGEYLICLRDFALTKHIPVKSLLKDTGQDTNFLLNPPNKVNENIMSIISRNLFNALPNPLLGSIEFGQSMAMSSHGALGLAIQGCKTLIEAATLVQHFYKTRASARAIQIIEGKDYAYLKFDNSNYINANPATLNTRYYTDFATLINIYSLIRKQLKHHTLNDLCIIQAPRDEPIDFSLSQQPKGLQVEFNSEHYQLGIPTSWLQLSLQVGDLELAEMAANQCEITLKQLSPKDLINQVYKVLDSGPSINTSLQEMASSLFMSPSTLQRRLRDLNTTFKQIKSQVRTNQAKALLKHTDQTLDLIADALGYSDASNFTKSFKTQTGLTPNAYRVQSKTH